MRRPSGKSLSETPLNVTITESVKKFSPSESNPASYTPRKDGLARMSAVGKLG
jgi:hypothetical protein